jgi:DNA-binding SARP family transcriptional activator
MTVVGTASGPQAASPPSGGRVRLRLIGEFELRAGRVLSVSPSAQRLLAYLALAGRPVQRSVVAGTLATVDVTEAQAAARLRTALWRLPRPGGTPLVDAAGKRIGLAPAVQVDYRETETAVAAGGGELPALAEDLLPDWDDDWVVLERERYRQSRLHALEQLCARHREAGDFDLALSAGLTAVGGEPLRESAHRQVVLTHLAEGNPAEALRQYDGFRRLLRAELGLPPSAAIRSLVAGLLGRPVDATGPPR